MPDTQHVQRLVSSLATAGWRATRIPARGRLAANRQLLILGTPQRELRLRLSVYKVGGTGRDRPDERRVEITTTYHAGMTRLANHHDVILGFDPVNDVYVGLDPRRLEVGGPTHNASTFVDRNGLATAHSDRIVVRPYPAPVLGGTELQAYFRPERLSEYLFNGEAIHAGVYLGDGAVLFSANTAVPRTFLRLPTHRLKVTCFGSMTAETRGVLERHRLTCSKHSSRTMSPSSAGQSSARNNSRLSGGSALPPGLWANSSCSIRSAGGCEPRDAPTWPNESNGRAWSRSGKDTTFIRSKMTAPIASLR